MGNLLKKANLISITKIRNYRS